MYCLELIEFDVSNTSYYVEVENGALILGGHGKSLKSPGNFLGKKCGN